MPAQAACNEEQAQEGGSPWCSWRMLEDAGKASCSQDSEDTRSSANHSVTESAFSVQGSWREGLVSGTRWMDGVPCTFTLSPSPSVILVWNSGSKVELLGLADRETISQGKPSVPRTLASLNQPFPWSSPALCWPWILAALGDTSPQHPDRHTH